jgi:LPXTG-site transpeptidase (sortase) family protein
MIINRHVVILISVFLISCTGPNSPNTPTVEEHATTVVSSGTAISESLPISLTPQTSASTQVAAPNVSPTSTSDFIPIIPNTGGETNPTNIEKPGKFNDFNSFLLPVTGFPPRMRTWIKINKPSNTNLITPTLIIPSLDVNMPIYGIEQSKGFWDVSWLWNEAGWLEGTAYPTTNGNSVLTGHVVTADGKNGPFVHLKSLTSDDYVFIVNSGFRYIYKVESIKFIKPNDMSVFSHEDDSWLTLITCDSYDEKMGEYLLRVVVRAPLVEIQEIK